MILNDERSAIQSQCFQEDRNISYLRDQLGRVDCFVRRELDRMKNPKGERRTGSLQGLVLSDADAECLAQRPLGTRAPDEPKMRSDEALSRIEARIASCLQPQGRHCLCDGD